MSAGLSSMSHRERVLTALDHQLTDRVPIAMVCSGINAPARRELDRLLLTERGSSVDAYLEPLIDIVSVTPPYVGPPLKSGEDEWGVIRQAMSYGDGAYDEIEHYPLAHAASLADLNAHRWPDPDWFDYAALPEIIASANARAGSRGPYCIMLGHGGNLFETSWYMRGFERAFLDLATQPAFFDEIMQRVTNFYVAYCRRALAAAQGKIDLVFTADDIGGQRGLLMSLHMWERHLKPYHMCLNETIHEGSAKVIYHTDGSVMPAVAGLVRMGIDIQQALQFDAEGMDPAVLKAEHGQHLCFQGGVSVQHTLPFGTAQDVRDETLARIRILGDGGGYILGPSHAIQAGTPPENILAMLDVAGATPMA